jgi:NDP-sugar pyrophosphorylase family protein
MGARLKTITNGVAKPLIRLAGKTLIDYSVEIFSNCKSLNSALFVTTGVFSRQISEWLNVSRQSLERHNPSVITQINTGILDAIRLASQYSQSNTLVCLNTDEIRLGVCFEDFVEFHNSHTKLATMLVSKQQKLGRHRLVEINQSGIITDTKLKPSQFDEQEFGLVNSGIIAVKREALDLFTDSEEWSGLINPLVEANQMVAYVTDLYYANVGTPEEYQEARSYLEKLTE